MTISLNTEKIEDEKLNCGLRQTEVHEQNKTPCGSAECSTVNKELYPLHNKMGTYSAEFLTMDGGRLSTS